MTTNPEFELLLLCARCQVPVERIRDYLGAESIDWAALIGLAKHQEVMPLLGRALERACWDLVPPDIQNDVKRFQAANARRNLILTGELLRILRRFEAAGIDVATFKGPVLAESVYGDLSLRMFADIDLIVRERDLEAAEGVLISDGYAGTVPDRRYREAFFSAGGQYSLRHLTRGIGIDLHWKLAPWGMPFPVDTGEVWLNLTLTPVAGVPVATFAPETLALFLTGHGTKEVWRLLKWVCDFGEFLHRHQHLDWVDLRLRAQRRYSSRALLLGCLLASELLEAPVDSRLLALARADTAVQRLALTARREMLEPSREVDPTGFHGFLDGGLPTVERLSDRVALVMALAFTPTAADHDGMPLPERLWGFYRITRPVRLLWRATKLVLKIP